MTKESVLYIDISTNQSLQPNKYNDIADGRYDGRIQKFQQGVSR